MAKARLAIDIGGTFTDLALIVDDGRYSAKVLTTSQAPEEGVLAGIDLLLRQAELTAEDIGLVIHGTTLATNAIIERKGAKTALIVTEGFRDSIEMAFENRFEQYDIFMDKPAPLVPRDLRLGVRERLDGRGTVLVPLDEEAVRALAPGLERAGIEAVAIGFMHAYLDGRHERRTREILSDLLPTVAFSLSSEVSREIREYERWSTAVANAYVQPVMGRYLGRLDTALRARKFACPLFMMTSGGGLMTLDTARRLRSGWWSRGQPGAPSSPPAWPGNAVSTRFFRSTWGARRRRFASSTTASLNIRAPSRLRANTASSRAVVYLCASL